VLAMDLREEARGTRSAVELQQWRRPWLFRPFPCVSEKMERSMGMSEVWQSSPCDVSAKDDAVVSSPRRGGRGEDENGDEMTWFVNVVP